MPPLYAYRVITPDGSGETFEVEQSANAPPIKKHPTTGQPVERVYDEAPGLNLKHSEGRERQMLSADNLSKKGFSRYERDPATGTYHKSVGETGPEEIRRED